MSTSFVPISLRNYSPYRRKDAAEWLAKGFSDFRVVDQVTRGSRSPDQVLEPFRKDYIIECRPASSGKWGKPVVYRAVPKDPDSNPTIELEDYL